MRVISLKIDTYAFSVQFGPLSAIVTGRYFDKHPPYERMAMLAHERGHIHYRHTSKRLWWLLYRWLDTRSWMEDVRAQEMEADAFAVREGHAQGLIEFLDRFVGKSHNSPLHPTPEDRILAILSLMEIA